MKANASQSMRPAAKEDEKKKNSPQNHRIIEIQLREKEKNSHVLFAVLRSED